MPNLLAHYLLIKRFSLKEGEIVLKPKNFTPFLKDNFDFLSLGTQGPDPLFYMGINPIRGLHLPTAMKKIGNRLHKEDPHIFFKALVDSIHTIDFYENGNEFNQFKAFIFGQFAHYLLDRETHPYILYISGFDDDGRITGSYHYKHAHLESEIDHCLARKFGNNSFLVDPQNILPNNKDYTQVIDKNLVPVLEKIFDEKKLPTHMYSNGFKNFRSWIKYVNHGTSIRAKMFFNTSLAAMRLPKEVTEDVLNEKKNVWLDPVSGERHSDSFMELHSKAFDLLENCYNDIMNHGFNYETFSKYIDDRNYYGTPIGSKWVYKKSN